VPRRSIISSLLSHSRASVMSRMDVAARRAVGRPIFASVIAELETRLSRECSLLAGLHQLQRPDLQSVSAAFCTQHMLLVNVTLIGLLV